MPIDWANFQTTLVAEVGSAYTPGGLNVFWRDVPQDWLEYPWCMLAILSVGNIGQDEQRFAYDSDLDQNNQSDVGHRRVVVQFTVRSRSQDLANSAWEIADVVRLRLRDDLRREALSAVGFSLGPITPANTVEFVDEDNRTVSAVVFDVTFLAMSVDVARDAGYIATAEITETIEDDAGNVVVNETKTYSVGS